MPSRRPPEPRRRGPLARCGASGLLAAMLPLAGGCATEPAVADARPADLAREALAPAAWLGTRSVAIDLEPGEDGATRMVQVEHLVSASGILLGENLLLTNAHVWAEGDEMPARRSFLVHRPLLDAPPVEHEFELIASRSRPEGDDGAGDAAEVADGRGADWALARCLDASWGPQEGARLHPRAGDPAWSPPRGTELLVVGYSPIFIRTPEARGEPPPRTALEIATRQSSAGPFVIRGLAASFRDRHCVTYPVSWPSPTGHSGGPVFVRDRDDGGLRLVGVFHTRLRIESSTPGQGEATVLGSLLEFDPIAAVCGASGLDPAVLGAAGRSTPPDLPEHRGDAPVR